MKSSHSSIKFPVIILSKPQLGKNIGSVARVMGNFCFEELRLVNPRDGWPNDDAISTGAGSTKILNNVRVFKTIEQACKDINILISTTARKRDLNLREISINKAISLSYMKIEERGKVGFLFGAESSGLSNEEIVMSDYTFSIPVNQHFSSINLSHSVMIVCWEFYKKNIFGRIKINKERAKKVYNLATNSEKEYFFNKMNNMLQKSNFFHSKNMNNSIMKNMKTLFNRSSLTTQELKTLNGIIKSLFDYNNDT